MYCKCQCYIIKDIPFPSVTLAGDTMSYFPLKQITFDQLTYDCSKYEKMDSNALDCLEKSKSVREIVRPVARSLMATMYKRYLEVVVADEARTADNWIRYVICYAITSSDPTVGDWALFLNPMMSSLSKENVTTRTSMVELYLNSIADIFKTPVPHIVSSMTELVREHTFINITEAECTANYFGEVLSHEAKAMSLLMIKVQLDNTRLTLANWNDIVLQLDSTTSAMYQKKVLSLEKQVDIGMKSLIQNDDVNFEDIMKYFNQTDDIPAFNSSVANANDSIIQRHYKELLQVAKYMMRPLNIMVTKLARVKDLQNSTLKGINDTFGRNKANSYVNYYPALLYCNLGGESKTEVCQSPETLFTSSGLGYSFNTKSFFQIYRENPILKTFCQEIVENTRMSGMCSGSVLDFQKSIIPIRKNGPDFKLRLLLHTRRKYKHRWILQKLGLHSSYSIPDTSANFIEPTAGTHTTVVVTPHITETDESMLQQDVSVRRCHSAKTDVNHLKLFKTYTRGNCIFECILERSIYESGCVPWNFPKLQNEVRTCSQNESISFTEIIKMSEKETNCSHCLEECWKVEYDYTLHTKPLKNICVDYPDIRSAVNMIVNIRGIGNFLPSFLELQEIGLDYHLLDACYSYAAQNAALVDIYIGPAFAVKITRRSRVTFLQQLANLGKRDVWITRVIVNELKKDLFCRWHGGSVHWHEHPDPV